MKDPGSASLARFGGREGFVIPATIFALLMMGVLAVAAILTADDSRRSSRAIRESNAALYAAESGLNEVWATWDDTLIAGLNPGDSLDFGWRSLPAGGGSYRVVLRRLDNGGQKMFALTSEGRGAGPLGGQRMISLSLSAVNMKICCKGSAIGGVQGEFEDMWLDSLNLGGVTASGFDTMPAQWGAACGNELDSIPAIVWKDTSKVEIENGAVVTGNPPVVPDTSIDSVSMYTWGHLNYDSLVARANITIGGGPASIGPVENPPGTCDTSVPTNWGAPEDPSSPCFDYFPIIHVANQLELELQLLDGAPQAGQGILLVDGSMRIERFFNFYGIIIVKDQFETEDNVHIFGGVIVGDEYEVENGSSVQYSQCAVNRVMSANELTITKLLASRSWGEVLR